MSFKDLLAKCFSSSDEVSFGRTMSAIAFMACMLWDTFFIAYAAYKYNPAIMRIADILPTAEMLKGQLMFCAGCYGITKIGDIVGMIWGHREQ